MMAVIPEQSHTKTMGKVLRAAWFYAPTFLTDRNTAEVSLFVRRFREIEMPSGKIELRAMRDVEVYDDEESMLAAIEEREMREWTAMDDNPPPQTVPDLELFPSVPA
jgi:hypothetical protein